MARTQRKPIGLATRFAVLAAGGFRCAYCGKRPPEAVLQVDHIIPVSAGGSNDRANLAASCTACNQGKSARVLPGPRRWEPLVADMDHPLRCPGNLHVAVWEEVPYGPPFVPARQVAMVCTGCRFIVAVRPVEYAA